MRLVIIGLSLMGLNLVVAYLALHLIPSMQALPWAALETVMPLVGVFGLVLVLFGLFRVVAGRKPDRNGPRTP